MRRLRWLSTPSNEAGSNFGVVTAFISQMPGDRLRSRDTSGRTQGFWRGQVPVQSLRDEVFILAPWTKLCQDHGLQPAGPGAAPGRVVPVCAASATYFSVYGP